MPDCLVRCCFDPSVSHYIVIQSPCRMLPSMAGPKQLGKVTELPTASVASVLRWPLTGAALHNYPLLSQLLLEVLARRRSYAFFMLVFLLSPDNDAPRAGGWGLHPNLQGSSASSSKVTCLWTKHPSSSSNF